MVRFRSIRVSSPLPGEPISNVGSDIGLSRSVWSSGLESILPSLLNQEDMVQEQQMSQSLTIPVKSSLRFSISLCTHNECQVSRAEVLKSSRIFHNLSKLSETFCHMLEHFRLFYDLLENLELFIEYLRTF